jgi:hypothetical protein
MHSLQQDFSQITCGIPATFRNLTLVPLLRPAPRGPQPGYLLAEDALVQGLAQITELADGGSVPELQLENHASHPILLLDGEELLGARQNRVLNLTILAPPQQVIILPVSCAEAGRWHAQSAAFRPASHVMYAQARAARTGQVTCSMRAHGTRRSDQSAVWNDIAAKASRLHADSPTQAMAAVYELHAVTTEEYVRAFDCVPLQAGVAFAIDGRVVGLDLFDHPHTLRRLFPKLVRSYALDALESAPATLPRRAGPAVLDGVLEGIAAATLFTQAAVGWARMCVSAVHACPAVRCGRRIATSTFARLRCVPPTRLPPSARASGGPRNGATPKACGPGSRRLATWYGLLPGAGIHTGWNTGSRSPNLVRLDKGQEDHSHGGRAV